MRASCPDPLILVEHRLDFSEYVPEGFGTGDLVIVADGVLEVVDFKGGRGVRVEAERNSQLMLYGLGALLEFEALYDIRNVRMTIVQPRLNNISTYETTTDELIRWAEKEVRPKALLAYEGKGEFCAGEWCRFCRARYTCRKRSEYHMRLAERDFKQPDLLTDEEILDILPVAESLNNWVAGPHRLRDAAGGGRQGLAGVQAGGRAQRAQVHQRGRGHQGRDGGRLHRHLQDDAAGRGRSGKAHGQEEVLRGAGQVRRQARGRAAARARKRPTQAVCRRGERFCTSNKKTAHKGRKEIIMATKVITGKVRASFVHIFEPQSVNGSEPKYSCSFIIPKSDTETIGKIREAVEEAQSGRREQVGREDPAEPEAAPARRRHRAPGRSRRTPTPTSSTPTAASGPAWWTAGACPSPTRWMVYSGCYVRASITFYPFNTNGNRGIACGLQNIQKWCDGEPLNGRVRAEDEFDALDDVDDEDFLN